MKAAASTLVPRCGGIFPEIFRIIFVSKTGGVSSSKPNSSTRNSSCICSSSIHQIGGKIGAHNNNNNNNSEGNENTGFPIDPHVFTTTTKRQTKYILIARPGTMRIVNPGSLPFLHSRATSSPVVQAAGFRRCLPVPVPTVEPPMCSLKSSPPEEDARRLVGEMVLVPTKNTP
jgi:hypothetical protein